MRERNDGTAPWGGLSIGTHFQPLFSVRRGACSGYEASLSAETELALPLPPGEVFAATRGEERIRLDWLCRALHLRNFATTDRGDRTLFLNTLPEAALHDATCPREFGDLIGYYGFRPERVCISILEAEYTDERALREAVAAYRDAGVSIAMDDFGVGRSNVDRIAALHPDIVKIDRSVLADAVGDEKARRMLPGIVGLLHDLGAQVAAEGIENAAEALVAIEAGADYLQGFYFAKPRALPTEEAFSEAVLRELLRMRESKPARERVVG